MNAAQLIPDMTRADMTSGLDQATVWEPACWMANTSKEEPQSRVVLPTKSMLVKASHESKWETSSRGHKLVIASMATSPNGILSKYKHAKSQLAPSRHGVAILGLT